MPKWSPSGGPIIAKRRRDASGKRDTQEAKRRAAQRLRAPYRLQRPIGGAKRPIRRRGPIARIRPAPTKNVASGPRIMIWRGPRQRRRRRSQPRLTRTHPSPSCSSFVRYLRKKPTNANSHAIAAECNASENGWQIVLESKKNGRK